MMMMVTMLSTFITLLVISPQLGLANVREPVLSIAKEEWELFKIQFSKTYQTIEEEQFRMKTFMKNKLMVLEHNQLFEQNLTTYEMDTNHLSDKLSHEVVATLNGLRGSWNENNSQFKGSMFIPPDEEFIQLPSAVDWRTKGIVTDVKNQEECGSCWAFATTGALEGQQARKTGHLVSLSEQDLMDCCTKCDSCRGGLMTTGYECIQHDGGIDSEDCYPYEGHDNVKCRFNRNKVAATVRGYTLLTSGSESELQAAVALVGPVAVGIDANHTTFIHYKSGVYSEPHCSSTGMDHGVLVVGYGTDKGVDYWLVKNSWSSHWGDKGYIKMARNANNMCAIATMASYPHV